MKFDPISKKLLAVGFIFYCIVTISSFNIPFFWDTILTSSIAHWFYDQGIQQGIAPIIWDAGHPTFFQIYLTLTWKIFGKSLLISHLSMLPFLFLIVISFIYLMQLMTQSTIARLIGIGLLLLHPYILTQSTMVSYDIVQIAFFLLTIIGILENKKTILIIGLWGLIACSVRGQIIAILSLATYCIIYLKNWKQLPFVIIISILPIIIWHFYHYYITGWMISTPSSTWESQRSFANPHQIMSNIIGITRGFVDYGVIALSLLFIIVIYQFRKIKPQHIERNLLLLFIIVFAGLNGSMILFSNPIGHRYFMILHVLMILLIISRVEQIKFYKTLISLVITAFITGHLWIYPDGRSNGWDVTLKYISYEKNRKQFWSYLTENKISTNEIQSAFPLFCSLKQTNLIEGERLFDISEVPQEALSYIAYSPVCNDMKSYSFIQNDNNYQLVQQFGEGKTAISLYTKIEY